MASIAIDWPLFAATSTDDLFYFARPQLLQPKAYYILDEILLAGELQEPSKKLIIRNIEMQDTMVQEAKSGVPAQGQMIAAALGALL